MSVDKYIKLQCDLQSKIFKAQSNFKKSPKPRITVAHIETRLELLEKYWISFEENHRNIIVECKDESDSYFTGDIYGSVEDKYIEYKIELKQSLAEVNLIDESSSSNVRSNEREEFNAVKLPKIVLPFFSGKYMEWPTFHDLFESLIHNNKSLADVQKLHYLKSHLQGEAEQLLRHIAITDANYAQCWLQLNKRYNNKRYIANCILARLVGQRGLTAESSTGVKQLLDTTNDCLNALSNLDVPVSTWDILIIHLMTLKLDQESRKQWEQRLSEHSDKLPLYSEFQSFLESRFRALEYLEPKDKREFRNKESVERPKVFSITTAVSCPFCSDGHLLYQCKKFAQDSCENRREFIQKKRLCFNCFGANHSVTQCKRRTVCRRCGRRHHSLLHQDGGAYYPAQAGPSQATLEHHAPVKEQHEAGQADRIMNYFSNGSIRTSGQVMLATALVNVENKGLYHTLRALLDQGSQASFVTEHAVQMLQLHKFPVRGTISGLGGDQSSMSVKHMVEFNLQSTNSSFSCLIQAYVLNCLTSTLPSQEIKLQDWPELLELKMADPGYGIPSNIDLLLGADVYGQILAEGIIRNPPGTLIAQNTQLGWIISGRVQVSDNTTPYILSAHIHDNSVNDLLRQFWEIETDQPHPLLSKEEEACERHFESTTTRDTSGRYVVSLPFRDENPSCQYGDSRTIAMKRFLLLEKKLQKNPLLKQEYSKVINEYLTMNHMELIQDKIEAAKPGCVYLPHHAVVREDKSTTKVRVVFDASCKGVNGKSLNDDLVVGPRLQPELRHIIMKWRIYPVCFVADIIKMYRMVKVVPEHIDFQRLLWRGNPHEDVKDYRMLRVTFGVSAAPYLAVKSLQQVAKDEGGEYPLAADRVMDSFYMDDFMSGCETDEEAVAIYHQMVSLLCKGGFQLQKWASNSTRLMDEVKQVTGPENGKDIKLDDTLKILGLSWNIHSDSFKYIVNLPPQKMPITKRVILSDISRLFDPLGWIAPIIIKAKIYMQKLWLSGLSWDQEVTSNLLDDWIAFRDDLPALNQVVVPRWVNINRNTAHAELHGFSDASNDAYAAVVYLRVTDHDSNIKVNLIAARTKVSPIKQLSIPRLELCGAVLLAKLLAEVSRILSIPVSQMHAWTDSTIVLAWLKGQPNRWKTFVANRITEILAVLNNDQWSHVESSQNPADCASRGLSPQELIQHELWFHGPRFLNESTCISPTVNLSTDLEAKPLKSHLTTTASRLNVLPDFQVWTKYSSLTKMIRVVAFCLRYMNKLRSKCKSKCVQVCPLNKRSPSYLTASELDDALKLGIKACQSSAFSRDIEQLKKTKSVNRKSNLCSLSPFLDSDEILRVRGRIQQSQVNYNVKHPIILPRDHHLSQLVVQDAHEKTLHGGPQLTLNYVRSKYFIINAKSLIKQYIKRCVRCLRYSSANAHPFMGELPSARVTITRPFYRSGVDYAGPINIRLSKGRGCRSYKGYIALFICMVTRCIHLEAVSSLTTEAFLAAFRRFTSRRGHCKEVWSDNGTNFVGASKELRILFQDQKSSIMGEIAEALALADTEWHFIPPHAPNFGGLWEAGVKSTKYHLKRVLDGTMLTFEELTTVLTQVEACLNSRPMYRMPLSQADAAPLTPGHFLIGEALVTASDRHYEDTMVSPLHRWQLIQKIMQQFWRKWSTEYLTTLYQRYKWTKITPEPNLGDVVLVKEDGLPPSKWLFGLIEEKHTGPDNVTRVVTLKCKNSKIVRPVSKLCILPIVP